MVCDRKSLDFSNQISASKSDKRENESGQCEGKKLTCFPRPRFVAPSPVAIANNSSVTGRDVRVISGVHRHTLFHYLLLKARRDVPKGRISTRFSRAHSPRAYKSAQTRSSKTIRGKLIAAADKKN